ncbi:hypothetical protein BJ742DRAFT_847920 [Cladochytrium replicatum]|nr:hypothetical protein BJ742DRAFT_847920 [Cladochytrium replicatum]
MLRQKSMCWRCAAAVSRIRTTHSLRLNHSHRNANSTSTHDINALIETLDIHKREKKPIGNAPTSKPKEEQLSMQGILQDVLSRAHRPRQSLKDFNRRVGKGSHIESGAIEIKTGPMNEGERKYAVIGKPRERIVEKKATLPRNEVKSDNELARIASLVSSVIGENTIGNTNYNAKVDGSWWVRGQQPFGFDLDAVPIADRATAFRVSSEVETMMNSQNPSDLASAARYYISTIKSTPLFLHALKDAQSIVKLFEAVSEAGMRGSLSAEDYKNLMEAASLRVHLLDSEKDHSDLQSDIMSRLPFSQNSVLRERVFAPPPLSPPTDPAIPSLVRTLFAAMKSAGIRPDARAFASMYRAHKDNPSGLGAIHRTAVAEAMASKTTTARTRMFGNPVLTDDAIRMLLMGYTRGQLRGLKTWERAWGVWQDLKTLGITPSAETCSGFLEAFAMGARGSGKVVDPEQAGTAASGIVAIHQYLIRKGIVHKRTEEGDNDEAEEKVKMRRSKVVANRTPRGVYDALVSGYAACGGVWWKAVRNLTFDMRDIENYTLSRENKIALMNTLVDIPPMDSLEESTHRSSFVPLPLPPTISDAQVEGRQLPDNVDTPPSTPEGYIRIVLRRRLPLVLNLAKSSPALDDRMVHYWIRAALGLRDRKELAACVSRVNSGIREEYADVLELSQLLENEEGQTDDISDVIQRLREGRNGSGKVESRAILATMFDDSPDTYQKSMAKLTLRAYYQLITAHGRFTRLHQDYHHSALANIAAMERLYEDMKRFGKGALAVARGLSPLAVYPKQKEEVVRYWEGIWESTVFIPPVQVAASAMRTYALAMEKGVGKAKSFFVNELMGSGSVSREGTQGDEGSDDVSMQMESASVLGWAWTTFIHEKVSRLMTSRKTLLEQYRLTIAIPGPPKTVQSRGRKRSATRKDGEDTKTVERALEIPTMIRRHRKEKLRKFRADLKRNAIELFRFGFVVPGPPTFTNIPDFDAYVARSIPTNPNLDGCKIYKNFVEKAGMVGRKDIGKKGGLVAMVYDGLVEGWMEGIEAYSKVMEVFEGREWEGRAEAMLEMERAVTQLVDLERSALKRWMEKTYVPGSKQMDVGFMEMDREEKNVIPSDEGEESGITSSPTKRRREMKRKKRNETQGLSSWRRAIPLIH